MTRLPEKREWFNPGEIARLFGFTRKTIYDWIRDERLPAKKIGGSLRVHRSDLEKFPKDIYE